MANCISPRYHVTTVQLGAILNLEGEQIIKECIYKMFKKIYSFIK